MSKKIIYLLSLLMALSLVFASCKKNSGLDPNNVGGGIQNEDNSGETGENGLYDDYDKIPELDKPIITYNVFTLNGTETYRNSIIVPMGDQENYLAVFSENRYTAVTSDNDIALDGETITDVVYNLSTKAGRDGSWIGKRVVGTTAKNAKESRAAIVVFKVDATHVVIVASQGAGISRVGTEYENRTWAESIGGGALKSNLQYTVGTLENNEFKWTEWKDIKVKNQDLLSKSIEELNFEAKSGVIFKQFGTHSARGVVNGNTIYVPIVVAVQGTSVKGQEKELMGNIILEGTYNGGNITSWKLTENKVAFDTISSYPDRSKQKESIIYDVTGSEIKYLTVPSGSAADSDRYLFTGTANTSGTKPSATGIKAGDGSPGLVKVKWHGSNIYDVSSYKNDLKNPDRILLMHVRDTESNLYINLIGSTDLKAGTSAERSVLINQNGKASSIDVLPDGTIITLAEEGLASGSANERKFNVIFKKYSQKYLDSILK